MSEEIGERADAYRNIDAIPGKIDVAVAQDQPAIDAGVRREELLDDRQNVQTPEFDRRRHREITGEFAAATGESAFRAVEIVKNAAADFEISNTRVGQRHVARGSRDQRRADVRLEPGKVAADRRQRHRQLPRGSGQASGLSCGDENCHGAKPVHLILPPYGNMLADITILSGCGKFSYLLTATTKVR